MSRDEFRGQKVTQVPVRLLLRQENPVEPSSAPRRKHPSRSHPARKERPLTAQPLADDESESIIADASTEIGPRFIRGGSRRVPVNTDSRVYLNIDDAPIAEFFDDPEEL